MKGIVETGADTLAAHLSDQNSVAIIFGTQTTIDAGTYPRRLAQRGISAARIVSQACPGLADTISEDRDGRRTATEIRRWVDAALAQTRRDGRIVACLACTHYGYRAELFTAAFEAAGREAEIVNPNERAAGDLFDAGAPSITREVEVAMVSRYAIPAATVETLTLLLGSISPRTVAALQNAEVVPDLF